MLQMSKANGGRTLTSLAIGVLKYLTVFYLGIQVGLLYTSSIPSDKKYPLIPINEEGSRRAEGISKRTTESGSVNTRTESGGFYPGGVTYYVNPRQGERDFYAIGNTYQTAR